MDLASLFSVIGGAFFDWLKLFAAPLKNLDMLWIIVPIWGVWLFSEFFQEKKGTSFGNAITNGAVMLFVGVDWIREIMRQVSTEGGLTIEFAAEIAISAVIILVSFCIVLLGIKGRAVVKYIGRARESTYVLLMFTPVIYGAVDFTIPTLAIILAFFPFFYIIVEIFDRILPNPQTFDLEEEEKLGGLDIKEGGIPGLQGDLGQSFGMGQGQPQMGRQFGQKGKWP